VLALPVRQERPVPGAKANARARYMIIQVLPAQQVSSFACCRLAYIWLGANCNRNGLKTFPVPASFRGGTGGLTASDILYVYRGKKPVAGRNYAQAIRPPASG